MMKLKMLVGFAAVLGALMATAAPALAEFQAGESKLSITSGTTNILSEGVFVARDSKGATALGEVVCPKAAIKAEWKIRSTGKLTEETKGPNQQPTKRGPHQQYTIKWENSENGCSTGGAPTDVASCTLQIHQPRGVLTGISADVVEACVIKVPALGCTLTIPATNEITGENSQLTKIDQANSGVNSILKANVRGITQVASGATCKLPSGNHGELNGLEIENLKEIVV